METYAKVGGILSIVSGAFSIFLGILFPALMIVMFVFIGSTVPEDPDFKKFMILPFVIYGVMGLFYILLGVFTIIGGTFAIKKKYWIVSVIAAVTGAFTCFPLGVAAIILITMAKDTFSTSKQDVVPAT